MISLPLRAPIMMLLVLFLYFDNAAAYEKESASEKLLNGSSSLYIKYKPYDEKGCNFDKTPDISSPVYGMDGQLAIST